MTTVFGQVTVSRMSYRAPGVRNLCPADPVLNLPVELYSYGLRKLVACESVRLVRGRRDRDRTRYRAAIGKRQVESLAQAAAADV